MNNKEFGIQLEQRTTSFAISLLNYCIKLPGNNEIRSVRNQIIRSGTSIGANYREANRARSKADFFNKIKICVAEANETVYWLELLEGIEANSRKNPELLKEAKELLAILTSISNSLYMNMK